MWQYYLKEWAQPLFYLTAIIAAAASTYRYYKNSTRERARWLLELYERFYEGSQYREIRLLIESGLTGFAVEKKDEALLQKLDDYLNFFEFISFLLRQKVLKKKEVLVLFDYQLRQIGRDSSISQCVAEPAYGFEGLNDLLKDLR